MRNTTNALLMIAAGTEVVTGLLLVVTPNVAVGLIFGGELSDVGRALAPLAGFGLLSLAWVCWPSEVAGWSPAPALRALLLFSILTAVYLIYRGISHTEVGILLWPAAVLHAGLAFLLGLALSSHSRKVKNGVTS